ncbi:MAG: flagellar hook-length control protein FliK [Lachnospiraceae bacterium]|nr:flagellar hook-length control protein FliK [Lachnospiraceae bacterium]
MQISDLLGQYGNNIAAGSQVSTKVKGVEQLVETVKQLKTGSVFEGTVNFIKGNQVILGLSSGQNITARLDKGVTLEKGQSVFFQVKSNDGESIQIKPMSQNGVFSNPTLTSALDAASLPVNERNINMVNAMMKQQMPIDAKSLQDMSRTIASTGASDPASAVEMTKLNIPLTADNVAMYENYKADEGFVVKQINQLLDTIPEMIVDDNLSVDQGTELQNKLVTFFTSQEGADASNIQNSTGSTQSATGMAGENAAANVQNLNGNQTLANESAVSSQNMASEVVSKENASQGSGMVEIQVNENTPEEGIPNGTLASTLPRNELEGLGASLSKLPDFAVNHMKYFDSNMNLKSDVNNVDLLKDLANYMSQNSGSISKEQLTELIGSKAYKRILKDVATEKMTLKPEELTKEHAVKDLYQRMEQQMFRLKEIADAYPKVSEAVAKAANNVSSNIDFMNAINQMYTYVQLPLKMSGQNVNGELYVYSNKSGEKSENDELTAFLHFDMDNLGPVDISVKLKERNVTTNWYLEDVKSLELIENNIDLLTKRLQDKGYNCQFGFENEGKNQNFVDELLQADKGGDGQLHRYSFDVRA